MSADDDAHRPSEPDPNMPAASRPSNETKCVEAAEAGSTDFEELVHERVLEFRQEYPELAETPLSETHGRKLRRIVTEAEWTDSYVEPDEPHENGFYVTDLRRRESAPWIDAVSAFLTAHVKYKGLRALFANELGESFEVPLTDAWGEEYSKKQYAKALALQRQMAGGERPSGGMAVAAWERPATAMITLTGTSVPGGPTPDYLAICKACGRKWFEIDDSFYRNHDCSEADIPVVQHIKPTTNRIGPVDQLDQLHDSFSYDGGRQTLRNVMEYHLGLEADSWGYWLQAEPHGVGGANSDGSPGLNACYTHLHVGVYFDAADLDLELVETELERVIDKHVETCEIAGEDAHENAISVNDNVENMGSYLATYMGGYTESLLEKPIEYIAWGAVYWSAARRRTSRSKVITEAVEADACWQRYELQGTDQDEAHGERVRWNENRGADVICECCGSGWGIDQDRLEAPPETSIAVADGGNVSEDSEDHPGVMWSSDGSVGFAQIGESPAKARVRRMVTEFVDTHRGDLPSLPAILGELGISPKHRDIAFEALKGKGEPETISVEGEPEIGWKLEAVIDRNGEEHPASGGGVDMASLHIPENELIEKTRLGNSLERGETFRCRKCNMATDDRWWIACHFVSEYGIEKPEVAERVLHVEDYNGLDRDCMKNPGKHEDET